MKTTLIGAGYVGLVSGVCFAELGHTVICLDTDHSKIEKLKQAKSPIYEPGLEALLETHLKSGRIHFTTDWTEALKEAEVVFIAVGTPTSRRGNGYADMSYVFEASRQMAPHLKKGTVVVNKSTVPVGSAKQVEHILNETNPHAQVHVASNPEFLREGAAIEDFMNPDRIVLGVGATEVEEKLRKIYAPLNTKLGGKLKFIVTTPETAELIKYASNAFLAAKISFINEMANLCETVGADVEHLAQGLGSDPRIGPRFLHPGPGYGGSCFPKDTTALLRIAQENGVGLRTIEAAVEVNHAQKARMVKKIVDAFEGQHRGKIIGVLGLTFKPNTDDMRDAPSLTILPALLEKGIKIRAHDPVGMEEARKLMPEIEYCSTLEEACQDADAACILTDWEHYKTLNFEQLKHKLRSPLLIDLRNLYSLSEMQKTGFTYISVGRRRMG